MRGLIHFTTLACALAIAGCNNGNFSNNANNANNANDGASNEAEGGPVADAAAMPLIDSNGQTVGEVRGRDGDEGATLLISARDLPPGMHGVHLHDVGLCDPPDFKSAGSHWNPTGKKHGSQNPDGAHAGDLQNVTVAADGTLQVRVAVPGAYLGSAGRDARVILDSNGAALVIHAQPDDYRTDPSGNSGDRIACAVLGGVEGGS